ncbi:ABC transporter, substrate-binding protein, aliphatic sulfonates family [Variovorax sp. PBS-H4]|nr:ABC transporter, substrate-binding protein, aliphatic sulfonates family [Variovorax sp. PBS-H4]
MGTQVLNISYPTLNLPLALGYWSDEGYDVEITPLAPPAQTIALLIAGQADFAQINASVAVQAQSLNNQPVKFVTNHGVIDWSVGVLEDSPLRSITDFKGKTIGVFGLGSGGVAILRAYLKDKGIDPDKDVKFVATGGGAPAIDALKSGRVQGLMFWASAMAGFENAGLKMRYLRGEDWRTLPDFSIAAMSKTIEADPKMVEAIVRGMAKASEFAFANPDCVRRIQWKDWPNTKSTGPVDPSMLAQWDTNLLKAQLDSFRDGYNIGGGKYWGNVDGAAVTRLEQYMLKSGQIARTVPASSLMIHDADLYRRANQFDVSSIRQAAEKCANW